MLNPVTEINGFEGKFDAMTSPIHQETSDYVIQAWRVSVLVGNKVSLNWKLKASSFTEVKVGEQSLCQMLFDQHYRRQLKNIQVMSPNFSQIDCFAKLCCYNDLFQKIIK